MRHDPLQEPAETDEPTSPRSTVLQNLRAYSTHVTVPAQLVAVHIPLTPFQDLDHCETMRCVVLTPGGDYETPRFHHAARRCGGRVVARGAGAAGDAGDRISRQRGR